MSFYFFFFYCLLAFLKITDTSFCGKNALPTSFEVTRSNYFILGCSQPACLNWPKSTIAKNRLFFQNIGSTTLSKTGVQNFAICENSYESTKCVGDGEWIGGIKSVSNNSDNLNVLCCKHEALKAAKFLDIYDIEIGQAVKGGEVKSDEKIIAFDYISNIIKLVTDQSIIYKVFINRLPCKRPSMNAVKLRPFQNKSHLKYNTTRLFQAPLLAVDNGRDSMDHSVALDACEYEFNFDFDACQANPTSSEEDFEDEFGESDVVQNRGRRSHPLNTDSMVMRLIKTRRLFQASLLTVDNDDIDGSGQDPESSEIPPDSPDQMPSPSNQMPGTSSRTSDHSVSISDCEEINNFYEFDDCDRFEEVDSDDEIESRLPFPPLQQPNPPPNFAQIPQNPPNPFQAPFQNNFDASLINPPPRDPSFLRIPEITPPPITPPPITPPPPMILQCFSGDTIVKIFNDEEKRLDELTVDDWVLSAGDNRIGFSKVISWLHKMPKETAEFLKFTLENGKVLKITQKHYIYKTDCLAKNITNVANYRFLYEKLQAENIQLSDCLLSMNHDTKFVPTRISKIEKIREKGIYAPLTDNGNIVVNSIFVSCYSEIDDELLQFTLPVINQYFNIFVDSLKIFYNVVFECSQSETNLIPGIHGFVQIVKSLL